MQTRSDQAQAYRFVTRRIVSALLSGEPETAERPMRRFGMAIFGSAMLAVIVFAVVGIIGFLFPSGARLPAGGAIVLEKGGGTYLYQGGLLYPAANFTSARLALRSENPEIRTVSGDALAGIPTGPMVGIAGLPNSLPAPKGLTSGPWSSCSRPDQRLSRLVTHLMVGGLPPGGRELGDRAMFIRYTRDDAVSQYHLVWDGRRMRVRPEDLATLRLTTQTPVEVTARLIESIPLGPDLTVPPIDNLGEPGRSVNGSIGTIGAVYSAADVSYVLLDSGLAVIGTVMRDLLLAGGTTTPIQIPPGAVLPASSPPDVRFQPPGFPETHPEMAFREPPAMVCAVTSPVEAETDLGITVRAYERVPPTGPLESAPGAGRRGPDGVGLADYVQITGGRAALVRQLPAPNDNTPNTTIYLVSQGYKFPLRRSNAAEVQAFLGYGGVNPVPVPISMLALLPQGPVLDPAKAAEPLVVDDDASDPSTATTQAPPTGEPSGG